MDDMTVSWAGIVIGILSVGTVWALSLISYWRRAGAFEHRMEEVEKQNATFAQAIADLRKYHDADMKEVRDFFKNSAGGQKFVTFPDHDLICERNSKTTVQQFKTLSDTIHAQTEELRDLSKEIVKLITAVAVLQDRRAGYKTQPEEPQ